ncbi:thioredoxin-like protein [Ascobolus immersus RN42]|uniref:Thioredoxin-like protein n=1 Tax=Ascobolus immersus RN42 TaxID=1160509 RepID=A0A3N4IRU3_ASCIM|nr:thioredoxin-like protein [Ascobolus immersus RN42]
MASLFRYAPSTAFFVPRTLRSSLPTTSTAFSTLRRPYSSTPENPTSSPTASPNNPILNPVHKTNTTPAPTISEANTSPKKTYIKVGDPFPSVPIPEGTPAHKVNVRDEIAAAGGEALIIGVPAAFTPTCSKSHIPGYLAFLEDIPPTVFVVSVNDPFVMNAWKSTIEGAEEAGFRFLSDYSGHLAKELGLLFPSEKLFGNWRMQRSVIYVNKNVVQGVWVEEDGTGLTGSTRAAEVVRRISRLKGRPIKGVLEKEDAANHPAHGGQAQQQHHS